MMMQWIERIPLNAIHVWEGAKLKLRFLNIQFALHQFGLMKMWKKCIKSSMRTDIYFMVSSVCNILGMSYATYQCVITEDLNMRPIAANCCKVGVHLLNDNQKQN
jgi:hypothetical protein